MAVSAFRFRPVNTINRLVHARVQTPRLLRLHDKALPEKRSAQCPPFKCFFFLILTFFVALVFLDEPSLLTESLGRLDSEVAQMIFQNILRLSISCALYPSSFSQILMGNHVAWLLKKERRHKCARDLSFSPNLNSASTNCSRYSRRSI